MEFLVGKIYKVTFPKTNDSYSDSYSREYVEYCTNVYGGYKISNFHEDSVCILITGSNTSYISFMYNGKNCYNYRDVSIFSKKNTFELVG